jgi:glutamate-1-semialdehyde aminotransferase
MQQHAPLIFLQHLAMMNLGVYTAPRGMYVLSTPMSTGDLDQAIGAFGEMLQTLRPLIEDAYPQLVAG